MSETYTITIYAIDHWAFDVFLAFIGVFITFLIVVWLSRVIADIIPLA